MWQGQTQLPVLQLSAVQVVLLLFVSAALLFFLYRWLMPRLVDQRIHTYQSSLLEQQYQEIDDLYRQMRGLKHDFHNHVQVLQAYLALERYEEMQTYLAALNTQITNIDTAIKTGNIMLDSILNSKISYAESHAIAVDATCRMPHGVVLSDIELCTVVGNLMDNAIEGALTLPDAADRFIRVYIRDMKDQLYIYVANSYQGRRKRKGGQYQTTKEGKDHGFGLRSIDSIVQRYDGYLNRQSEEEVFVTEVMLPLRP